MRRLAIASVMAVAGFIAAAGTSAQEGIRNWSIWEPMANKTMADLIGEGYEVKAVVGHEVFGNYAEIAYLQKDKSLIRCGSVVVGPLGQKDDNTIVCNRLVRPYKQRLL